MVSQRPPAYLFVLTFAWLIASVWLPAQEADAPSPDEASPAPETTPVEPEPTVETAASAAGDLDLYQDQLSKPIESSKGRFVGKAYDAKSGKPLVGVAIQIQETGDLTITDDKGRFIIDQVEPGTYTIIISQTGYQPMQAEGVSITSGELTTLASVSGALEPAPVEESDEVFEMDEIEVVAELVEEGAESQLFDRKELEQLINTMGKAQFDEVGAGDVISAVGRMTGANVVDGKYAVIRGLADRYSNTTLNGALIPSGDPSKKAVQLDLIATHLLEELRTYKTASPELTGEFAGGLVDIRTLKFPEELTIAMSVGAAIDSEATKNTFYKNPDRSMDFLGRVGDALPDGISDIISFPRGVTRSRTPPSAAQVQAREEWRAIHSAGTLLPDSSSAGVDTSFSFSVGNSMDLNHGTFGFMLAFDQGHEFNTKFHRELNRGSFTTGEFTPRQSQIQNVFDENIEWGGLGTLAYRSKDERHVIGVTLMTNNALTDSVTQGRRVQDQEDGQFIDSEGNEIPKIADYLGKDARIFRAYDEIGYLKRSLDVAQLTGEHQFTRFGDLKMDYVLSLANAEEDRPDQRHYRSYQVSYDDPAVLSASSRVDPTLGTLFTQTNMIPEVNEKSSYRTYGNTSESAFFGQLGFELPLWEGKDEGDGFRIKFGGSHFDKSRQVRGRLFAYDRASSLRNDINENDQTGLDFHEDFAVSDESINGTGLNRRGDGVFIRDLTAGGGEVRNVDASSQTDALYIAGAYSWNGLSITGGFRYEEESRGYDILAGLNDPNIVGSDEQVNQYILPSISLNYTFGREDQFKLRASYGRTVARPTFYEFAPVKTIDQQTGLQINGNQDLEDTLIDNFDLGFEWYPNPGEMFSVSLFHKEMENPIVTTVGLQDGTTFFRSWRNSESGTISGIELEGRKKFWDNWTIGTNFAYIKSEIGPLSGAGGNTGSATVFEGQPEFIFNLNLGYKNDDWGLTANLVYNYTDDILTDVTSSQLIPNVFKRATHSLDFFLSKDLGKGFKFKFGIENILGDDFEKYYEGEELIYDTYTRPRTFKFGLGYSY